LGYDKLNNKKILITGSSGYIGKNLINYLKKEKENYIFLSKSFVKNCIECDLSNQNDVLNLSTSYEFERIINLAGYVPKKPFQYQSDTNDINILISENISLYFDSPLIHVSSLSIYEKHNSEIIDETQKINIPISKYAYSKYKSELILKNKYKNILIFLRIPGIFGGIRTDGVVYNSIKSFINNERFYLKSTPKIWSTMYIDDCVLALIKLLKNKLIRNLQINYNYEFQFSINQVLVYLSRLINNKLYLDNKNNSDKKSFKLDVAKSIIGLPKNTIENRLKEYTEILMNYDRRN